MPTREERTLEVVERVAAALASHGAPTAVIGAVAAKPSATSSLWILPAPLT